MDPRMFQVLLLNWLAFLCFAFLICWSRYRLEVLQRELDEAHALESFAGADKMNGKAGLPLHRSSQ